MAQLRELVDYTHRLLEADRIEDYAPNGLQVEGRPEVTRIIAGVSASLEWIEAAARRRADAIIVHHGYFWRNEQPCVVGVKKRRLELLLGEGISLLAYHLPLDAHAQYGNNAQLARVLDFEVSAAGMPTPDGALLWRGALPRPMTAAELVAHIAQRLGRAPLHIAGQGDEIRTIAWCSGAAQGYLEQAALSGIDAYLTGEASEQSTHVARETGVHFFAAGHHATERYGVQALARHLAERFGLEYDYVEIDNPV